MRTQSLALIGLAALGLGTTVGPAMADEPRGAPRGTADAFHFQGLSFDPLRLLGSAPVQTEIALSDDQKGRITSVLAAFRAETGELNAGLAGLSRAEIQQKFAADRPAGEDHRRKTQEILASRTKEAEAVLTPEQAARLKEIDAQLRGAALLNAPEVARELDLTAAQRETLAALQRDDVAARRSSFAGLEDRAAIQEQAARIEKETRAKVFEVLTDAQRATLAKRQGKPIGFDAAQLFAPAPRVIRPR